VTEKAGRATSPVIGGRTAAVVVPACGVFVINTFGMTGRCWATITGTGLIGVLVPDGDVATPALVVGRGANGEDTIGVRITCGVAVGRTIATVLGDGCGLNTATTGPP
jgi:hypothetical protein